MTPEQLLERALLSLTTYAASSKNRIPTGGWEIDTQLTVNTPWTGFVATVYRKGNEVVVSFRGTDGPSFPDWAFGNFGAAAGGFSPQVMQAINLVADVLNKYEGIANVSFTGHSLGGGLASLMGAFFNKEAAIFDPAPFGNTALNRVIASGNPLPGSLGLYFSTYAARQLLYGRTVSSEFQSYVATFVAGSGSAQDALYNQRISGITGKYLQGEILIPLRAVVPTVVSPTGLTQVDIGNTTLNPGDATALHSIELLLAMMSSPGLQDASKQLPTLLELLGDDSLYSTKRTNDSRTNFLNRLLGDHFRDGTPHSGSALDRFAQDVLTLAGADGVAQNHSVRDALIAASIEYFNFKDLATATYLFSISAGGIHFKYSDIGATSYKSLPKLKSAVEAMLDASDKPLAAKLLAQDAWHIQSGAEPLNWTAAGNDNDAVIGGFGADVVDASAGNDVIIGGEGNDQLAGGAGNDTLIGGLDSDTLDGGAGNDELYGGSGNDTLITGSGRDLLDGGADNDTYRISYNATSTTIRDSDGNGSIKIDRAVGVSYILGPNIHELSGSPGSYEDDQHNRYRLSGNNLIIQIDDGGQVITIENFATMSGDKLGINLQGPEATPEPTTPPPTTFSYEYIGTDSDNTQGYTPAEGATVHLVGNGGNDELTVAGSQLHPDAAPAAVVVDGGEGNDRLEAFGHAVWESGGAGNDLVSSWGGNLLVGGAGSDVILGGSDDDSPGRLYGDAEVAIDLAIAQGNLAESNAAVGDLLSSAGDNNDEVMVGTNARDVLAGGGGQDELIGRGGDDLIFGDAYVLLQFVDSSWQWPTFQWDFSTTVIDTAGGDVKSFYDSSRIAA